MGSIALLLMYIMIIAILSVVFYFVIKNAVKDALIEYNREDNKQNK